jgi:hypothetical protein
VTLTVYMVSPSLVVPMLIQHHYLHRKPPISWAFGLFDNHRVVGACTFGVPASNHMRRGVCPSNPSCVLELNRLWVDDGQPRNTESWFVARCLAELPALIVVSYADSAHGHSGYVYRASNFYFAGMTDADRKTPRFDYVTSNGHSRGSFRGGQKVKDVEFERVPRQPKWRYWTTTGNRRERRKLEGLCKWQKLSWHSLDPTGLA